MSGAVRTTILLDPDTRRAAKQLAAKLDVSPSEAMRRATIRYRDELIGAPSKAERVRRRLDALARAPEVFKNMDPAAEMRRIRRERGDW